MWIDDVVTLTTIASTWGNNIRNRIVQTFDTISEANTRLAALPDGARCYVAATALEYVKRSGAWRLAVPIVVKGNVAGNPAIGNAAAFQSAALTVPAGYAVAALDYTCLVVSQPTPDEQIELKVFSANGGTQVFSSLHQCSGIRDLVTISSTFNVNVNGDQVNVTIRDNAAGNYVVVYADNNVHQIRAVLFP